MGVCPSKVGCWRRAEKDEGDRADAHEAKIEVAAEFSMVVVATRSWMREMTVWSVCLRRVFGRRENHVEDDEEAIGRGAGGGEGRGFSSMTVDEEPMVMVSYDGGKSASLSVSSRYLSSKTILALLDALGRTKVIW